MRIALVMRASERMKGPRAMATYMKELKRILCMKSPINAQMSHADLEREIAKISDLLRGPLSNVDRLDLVEARQRLRRSKSDT